MTPRWSHLACAYPPAEVFSFLPVQEPTVVRVCGMHNFQFGSGAQGFFRLRPSKERRSAHLFLALGTERQKRSQKTCRHSTMHFTPALPIGDVCMRVALIAEGLRRGADRFVISPKAAANLSSSQPGNEYQDWSAATKGHRRSCGELSLKLRIAEQLSRNCAPQVAYGDGTRGRSHTRHSITAGPDRSVFLLTCGARPMVFEIELWSVPKTDDCESHKTADFGSAVSATCIGPSGRVFGTPAEDANA